MDDLWQVVEPYLRAEGLELDDLEFLGRGRSRTLRVVVDREGGIDLDRLGEVSHGLSRVLDHDTNLDGPYQLEVTSPGLERRLRRPEHFHKSIGREVVVKATSGSVRGVLVEAGPEACSVRDGEVDRSVPYRDLVSARTVYRWEKPSRPGGRK
jgi:ribosome maturation factor RimP